MPIIYGLDRHQLTFSSLEATIATKKAVIVKLLLVYLKTKLRKLHNTLLASYGSVQRAFISCPPGKTKA